MRRIWLRGRWRKSGRPCRGPAALAWIGLLLWLVGCGSMQAAPRYGGRPGAELSAELARREKARGSGRALEVAVDGYLGVPYLWGGTTRAGMDCSALVRAVYREAYGIELPRTSKQMFRLGSPVSGRSLLRPGDLVFFRLSESGPGVSHVGVYLGDGRFAHASSSRGGSIARLQEPYFSRHYAGARRVLQ